MDVQSVDELRSDFDEIARRLLGISGAEFERRSWTEIWPDTPAVNHLLFLLDALTPEKERRRRYRAVQKLLDAD